MFNVNLFSNLHPPHCLRYSEYIYVCLIFVIFDIFSKIFDTHFSISHCLRYFLSIYLCLYTRACKKTSDKKTSLKKERNNFQQCNAMHQLSMKKDAVVSQVTRNVKLVTDRYLPPWLYTSFISTDSYPPPGLKLICDLMSLWDLNGSQSKKRIRDACSTADIIDCLQVY